MNEPTPPLAMTLTTSQRFEVERMDRMIDNTTDLDVLRGAAKQFHRAWQTQRAASRWLIDQSCDAMQAEQAARMEARRRRRTPMQRMLDIMGA